MSYKTILGIFVVCFIAFEGVELVASSQYASILGQNAATKQQSSSYLYMLEKLEKNESATSMFKARDIDVESCKKVFETNAVFNPMYKQCTDNLHEVEFYSSL